MANPVEFVNVFCIKQEQEDEEIESNERIDFTTTINDSIDVTSVDKLPNLELTFKEESCETLQEGEFVFDVSEEEEKEAVILNQEQFDKPVLEDVGTHFLLPVLTSAPVEAVKPKNSKIVKTSKLKTTPKAPRKSAYSRPPGSLYQRFSCSTCHTPYSSERGLAAHVQKTHKSTVKYIEGNPFSCETNDPAKSYSITKALKIVPSKIQVMDPKNSANVYHYNQCPKCSARFFSEQSLKSHFSSVHGKVDSKTIIVPSEELPPLKMLPKSNETCVTACTFDANTKFYQCTFCTTRFLNENSLKRHISNIHGEVSA